MKATNDAWVQLSVSEFENLHAEIQQLRSDLAWANRKYSELWEAVQRRHAEEATTQ
jgi:hypothetical protein